LKNCSPRPEAQQTSRSKKPGQVPGFLHDGSGGSRHQSLR
jgi:hypothetical protein